MPTELSKTLTLPDLGVVEDPILRQVLNDFKKAIEEVNRAAYEDVAQREGIGGTPTTIEIGDAAAEGSSTDRARADHNHPVGDPTAPPSLTKPQTATEGTSVIPMRSDAKAGIPTPATPTTQAFSDAATSGVGTGFATDTHLHGMMASPTLTQNFEAARVSETLSRAGSDGSENGTDVSVTLDVESRVIVIVTGNLSAVGTGPPSHTIDIRRGGTTKESSPAVAGVGAGICLSWYEILAAGTYAFDVQLTTSGLSGGTSTFDYQIQVITVPNT